MANVTDRNLYDRLGVDSEADLDAIKSAYRERAKRAHPDRGGEPAAFQKLQQAFDVLSDPDRRRRYDKNGSISDQDVLKSISTDLLNAMVDGGHQDHILEPLRELTGLEERLADALKKTDEHLATIDSDVVALDASDRIAELDELIAALHAMQRAATAQRGEVSADLEACRNLVKQYEMAKEILGRDEAEPREKVWMTVPMGSMFSSGNENATA